MARNEMDSQFYGMISEDHSAVANLPQEVVQKAYPRCEYLDGYSIDDTIRGLDDTRKEDMRTLKKHHSKVKA